MKILCAALKRNLPIDRTRRLIVSKKSTRSPTGMPLAKIKDF